MKKLFAILTIIAVLSLSILPGSAYAGTNLYLACKNKGGTLNSNGQCIIPAKTTPTTNNNSGGSGNTTTCTNPKGCGPATACTNAKGCPPSIPAQAKMSLPKMFYIPHFTNGLEIQKVPEDILDNSSLENWLFGLGVSLVIFGFIYNMYMNLYRLSVGAESKNSSYWQLLRQMKQQAKSRYNFACCLS